MRSGFYFSGVFAVFAIMLQACATASEPRNIDNGAEKQPLIFKYDHSASRAFNGRLPSVHSGELVAGPSEEALEPIGTLTGWDINHDGVIDFYALQASDGRAEVLSFDFDGDGLPDRILSPSH